MGSDAEAQAAIAGMNGQSLGGRAITVNETRPMEARPPRTGGFGGGGGDRSGGGGYGGRRWRRRWTRRLLSPRNPGMLCITRCEWV